MYAWCVQWMDAEKREEFEYQLNDTLPDARPGRASQATREHEGELFMAAMAKTQAIQG